MVNYYICFILDSVINVQHDEVEITRLYKVAQKD